MKNLMTVAFILFFGTTVFAGDPVARLISKLETNITLTQDQKAEIQTLAEGSLRAMNKPQAKTTGRKGTRKTMIKQQAKELKRKVFNQVLTASQRQSIKDSKG